MNNLFYSSLPKCHSGKQSIWQCKRCKIYGFDPWVEKTLGGGSDTQLQYSSLENPMDRGAWWTIVQGVTKSQT